MWENMKMVALFPSISDLYVCAWVSGMFLLAQVGVLEWAAHGTITDRKTKWGKFVRVFFTRNAVFIFCFFSFKVWAPNCKGNMSD